MFDLKTVFVASQAEVHRGQVAYRAAVIAALGWEPENPSDRYAASTGEMVRLRL